MLLKALSVLSKLSPIGQIGALAGAASVIFSAGFATGTQVEHWREGSKRTALLEQIGDLKSAQIATERARADSALAYAQSLERLSAASDSRWADVLAWQAGNERSLEDFIREVEADESAAPCLVSDADLDRWLRFDAGNQD